MDFVKREDQNLFDEEEYKGYVDMLQKLHHMEATMGDFQNNPMLMEHLHQAMQNTLSANIVHNLQLPLSPRQMLLKNSRTHNYDLPHIRNLTTTLETNRQNEVLSNLNDLELAHNIGLSETQNLHNDLAQNLVRMNQELDMSQLINQEESRRIVSYENQIIDQRLLGQNSGLQDHNAVLPMPFQIKSEQDDDYFYDVTNQGFVNNGLAAGHATLEQGSITQDQVYMYNNQLPTLNVPLNSIDFYSRQQTYLQNYPATTRENPQNLVINRQYNIEYEPEKQKENDIEKNLEPKKNYEYDSAEHAEQNFVIGKNENDSNIQNKISHSQDDINYKNLIENEYNNIKGEYVCYKCNNIFPSKRGLKIHSKVCPENGENSEKVGKFICTQCSYKCQSPAILKIHERTHTGEKPFSCTFCDYKSGQKNNVAKHILVHMKEKPFRCQYCEYRCAQKNNLVVHERTHTGYKPFACPYCDYRTVQKPNLVKHMYLHTDERPFSCDLCSYKCVQKTNLTKHKLRHSNERNETEFSKTSKPYRPRQKTVKCQYCTYSCVQKTSLDKHMQYKHTEIQTNLVEDIEKDVLLNDNETIQNLCIKKFDENVQDKAVLEEIPVQS